MLLKEGVSFWNEQGDYRDLSSVSPVLWIVTHLVSVLLLATCTKIPCFCCLCFWIEQSAGFDGKSSSPKKCLQRQLVFLRKQNIFESEKHNLCLVDRKLQHFTVILDAGNISKFTTVLYIASF